MSSDNYFVVRKHPDGGYTYVTGFDSDTRNNRETGQNYLDIPVRKWNTRYRTYERALESALEDFSEYGVWTHPECAEEEAKYKSKNQ
jgi:hypothetical protein